MNLKYSKAIVDFLRTTRRSKDLTIDQVAEKSKLARTTVHSLENGAGFTLATLITLCGYYGLLPSTVFEFAELAESLASIEKAYDKEYPHLHEHRRIYGYRTERLVKPKEE